MSGRGLGELRGGRRILPGRARVGCDRAVGVGVRICVILGMAMMLNPLVAAEEGGSGSRSPTATNEAEEAAERPLVVPNAPIREFPRGSPDPGLDALLQLPSSFIDGQSRAVAGAGKAEWRRRFSEAQIEFDEARTGVEETKRELDSVAEGGGASTWSVAPPGGGGGSSGGPSASPLSFKLRQQLKETRERLKAAERAVRELRIEADLAGVPANWRGDPVLPPTRAVVH